MNRFLIIGLLIVLTTCSYEIQTYEIPKSDYIGKNPLDLAHIMSEAQPEILRKILIHYLTEEINILEKANSKERIN